MNSSTVKECRQCPKPEHINNPDAPETYYYMRSLRFDVTRAKKLVALMPKSRICEMTREQVEEFGFALKAPEVAKDGSQSFTIGFYGHIEEHLAHIPDEKLREPVILATLVMRDDITKRDIKKLSKMRSDASCLSRNIPELVKLLDSEMKKLKDKPDNIAQNIMIDGTHRTIRNYRDGATAFPCVVLTPEETQSIFENVGNMNAVFFPKEKAKKRNKK